MDTQAYITSITNNDYLPGLYALTKSLKSTNPKFPLYVIVPDNKKDVAKHVSNMGISTIELPQILSSDQKNLQKHYWTETFFKLNVLNLTQFKKIVFLDSDMLILKNIDFMFEKPHMSAVVSGWVRDKIKCFCTAMITIEPDNKLFENSCLCANKLLAQEKMYSDEDVLNEIYSDWFDKPNLRLPEHYSEFVFCADALLKKDQLSYDDFYTIHFPTKYKPWNTTYPFISRCRNILYRDKTAQFFINKYLALIKEYKNRYRKI